MEVEGLPLDLLSNLPTDVIKNILTLLPMRDAFRASIMSQNWRDHCLHIPKLTFDDEMFEGSIFKNLPVKCKLLHVIFPILLLHQGPIIEFKFCMSELSSCREIDQIILHLSRTATIKKLFLGFEMSHDAHKLPPSFFKMHKFEDLEIGNCVFQPPSTFKGFSRLSYLFFFNVSIDADVLVRFISNCPRLTKLILIGEEKHFMGSCHSGSVELFKHLPLIESLTMNSFPLKWFASGIVPQKLPSLLVNLKHLCLDELCFASEPEIRGVLLLVTSYRNIEIIEMQMGTTKVVSQPAMNIFDLLQDYSYVILDRLQVIHITNFTSIKPGMDFVKLILTKSVMLQEIYIEINKVVDIDDEVKMLKELIEYPRASTLAKIIFKRP